MTKIQQISFFNLKNILLFFIFISTVSNAQTVYTSGSTLRTAVNAAGATGGVFILKDGEYTGLKVTIEVQASAGKPIIIRPETIGGVTLLGSSAFTFKKSAFVTLEGFKYDCTGNSTMVKFEGSNNIRITRNVFKLTTTSSVKWLYIGGVYDDLVYPYLYPSHHNRIDHNIFQDKSATGHYITIDGNNSVDQSQYDLIDHNYFKNNGPRAVNEQESIRVGWSDMSKSSGFTTIEYNLFENCDGDPEVVSIKSCDNIVRHNTFNGNYGTLSFRHGNRNRAEGNYFFGNNRPIGSVTNADLTTTKLYTGGVRIYGTDHVVINNYFEGLNGTKWDAPITLTQGDVIEGQSTSLSSHFRPERVMIAYNTLVNNDQGIELGFSNNGAYGKGLANITITNNLITGTKNAPVKIVDGKDPGTNVTWSNNLIYTNGAAVIEGGTLTTSFTTAQVMNENPNLVFDNAQKTWRSGADTPLYTNTTAITNYEDIDGQSRPAPSNPGADHYDAAMTSVRYMPMTTETVGPLAYEDVPLALSPITSFALAGETKGTTVTTALAWTASVDSNWLSIDNAGGTGNGIINITATANTTGASRSGILTVTGASLSPITITVIQDGPTISLSEVTNFVAGGETKATSVTSNVAWTASIDNPSWLSINTTSGTNNGSINITAAANTLITSRTGTLTVMGGGLTKTLTITQDAAVSTTPMINAGVNGFPVTVTATNTQAGANVPLNTLDKNTSTKWSDDGTGAPYGTITYDLGEIYTLESIKLSTTGTSSKLYYYGFQFSTDGTNYSPIVNVTSALASQTTYKTYAFTDVARYVKITGGGNNAGTAFTSISEIEFYGNAYLSVAKKELKSQLIVYPNPASTTINVQLASANATQATIYSIDGRLVLSKKLNSSESSQFSMDVSTLKRGNYVLKLEDNSAKEVNSKIISITK